MKVTEISKEQFKDRLIDSQAAKMREKIKEFEDIIAEYDFRVIVNEQPYYDGVWTMTAIANVPEPQRAVQHPKLQDVRVAYYRVFTHFERENNVTIMNQNEGISSIMWHIHFN